jgi:DNA-binding transcriptional regulator YiaG
MKKKYINSHCEAIYETVSGLYRIGLIPDEEMRYFDEACLVKPPVPRVPTQAPPRAARSGAPVFSGGK